MPTPRSGYVYFIGSERFGWYKIGRSYVPRIRVDAIGVLLPFRVQIYALWKAHDAVWAEIEMHEKFADNRINGEWFGFDFLEAMAIAKSGDFPWFCEKVFTIGDDSEFSQFSNMQEDVLRLGKSPQAKLRAEIREEFKRLIALEPIDSKEAKMFVWGQATDTILAKKARA
jgi:hypothetical protein